jgi:hypothetical protein
MAQHSAWVLAPGGEVKVKSAPGRPPPQKVTLEPVMPWLQAKGIGMVAVTEAVGVVVKVEAVKVVVVKAATEATAVEVMMVVTVKVEVLVAVAVERWRKQEQALEMAALKLGAAMSGSGMAAALRLALAPAATNVVETTRVTAGAVDVVVLGHSVSGKGRLRGRWKIATNVVIVMTLVVNVVVEDTTTSDVTVAVAVVMTVVTLCSFPVSIWRGVFDLSTQRTYYLRHRPQLGSAETRGTRHSREFCERGKLCELVTQLAREGCRSFPEHLHGAGGGLFRLISVIGNGDHRDAYKKSSKDDCEKLHGFVRLNSQQRGVGKNLDKSFMLGRGSSCILNADCEKALSDSTIEKAYETPRVGRSASGIELNLLQPYSQKRWWLHSAQFLHEEQAASRPLTVSWNW